MYCLEAKLVGDHAKAKVSITANTTVRTVNNMGNEFKSGAVNSLELSAIPLMVEGVHNLYLVANGEKKFEEAAKDMGKLTTNIALTGGGRQVITTGLDNTLKNKSSELLKKIGNSNQVTQIITIALILKDSVIKYVNGEIDWNRIFCRGCCSGF